MVQDSSGGGIVGNSLCYEVSSYLVLVNGVAFLFVLKSGAELGLALVNPCDKMIAGGSEGARVWNY